MQVDQIDISSDGNLLHFAVIKNLAKHGRILLKHGLVLLVFLKKKVSEALKLNERDDCRFEIKIFPIFFQV